MKKKDMVTLHDARLKFPFAMLLAGSPMSGKSSFVTRLLEERSRLIDKEIDRIVWCYGQRTKALDTLEHRFGIPVTLVSGIPDSFDKFIDNTKNTIFVLDDLDESRHQILK